MAKFTDAKGREWEIAISVLSFRKVRSAVGYDLNKISADPTVVSELQTLLSDTEQFGAVLFELVKSQHEEVKLEEFLEGLAGDALESAREAFVKAYAVFSPSRIRTILLAAVEKGEEIRSQLASKVTEQMKNLTSKDVVTKLLESSGSTQVDSPSGN